VVPVVLVHGWGGSFAATWVQSGFTELLADAGRPVIGVDLLGHGEAPKPHDPASYTDMTGRVFDAIPDTPVDGVGFSLGAITLLEAAISQPNRFNRLVLAGIGRGVLEHDRQAEPDEQRARLFAQYANRPGNDPVALEAVLGRPRVPPTEADLAAVTCPVLIAVGDADFVLPADRLVAALPNAEFRALRRTDHFATPESFEFIDATLEFLGADPAR
jgi:pimeloyl-ACP methyl ester carboxylesterase